ncbi:SDR family NAD(P)-dependent oxidoreductase [Arthrobacter sp. RT-1]|uniref:SDR family oxidoreductase n=1 Tax=Arthrobacter sp. RT-1 TaxID=2292263 RepID=UPI000E1ECB51|nr:SDR family oxidoreductase [Arthrobacter sp. RT-1]RDV08566.1 SDR family NAD(P)-dependent oxidoreductase [Arthrobacter sp. RT-1]
MILVVGATGQLGGLIAQALIDKGFQVRILVREGSAYDALVQAGAEAPIGDLKDPASLAAACAGVDTIVTTANSSARGGEDTVDSVDRRGNRNLIEAAVTAGVHRFVFVSNLGASPESPNPFMAAKGETERLLRNSGMSWTILQPNLFMDKLPAIVVGFPAVAGQPVTLVGEGRRVHSLVAMQDVARYVLAVLEHPERDGQLLVIGGPTAVSWRDAVAEFELELGREVPVRTVPPGQPIPGMPDMLSGFLALLETYDSRLDMEELSARYDVPPTTLRTWVHDFVLKSVAERPRV